MAQKICCGGFELGEGLELDGKVLNVTGGIGTGDMTKAVYDADGEVETAGGISAYVEAHGGGGGSEYPVYFSINYDEETGEEIVTSDHDAKEIVQAIQNGEKVIGYYAETDGIINRDIYSLLSYSSQFLPYEIYEVKFIRTGVALGIENENYVTGTEITLQWEQENEEVEPTIICYRTLGGQASTFYHITIGTEYEQGKIFLWNENGEKYAIAVSSEGMLTCTKVEE